MIILVLALWVRIHFLSVPIRYDEAWGYNFYASKPLSYGLSQYIDPNNHLLNTFLVHEIRRHALGLYQAANRGGKYYQGL